MLLKECGQKKEKMNLCAVCAVCASQQTRVVATNPDAHKCAQGVRKVCAHNLRTSAHSIQYTLLIVKQKNKNLLDLKIQLM